ncbi:hypothetical protein [Kluyvera sichuanensis]|uniref:hypothetical protein n=1 Tax=Kluyvera sichuanensis TaxID=2725494 RepID=UPI002FD126C1
MKATCHYKNCHKNLSDSRNKRFCSNECRHKAHRIIDDDNIVKLVKHSWWLNIESMLKNNPCGLGSINDPDDVADVLQLYRIKSCHQRAYNVLYGKWVMGDDGLPLSRLRPWLELEVSHLYPNSKGGANISKNLLIAPKSINRMLKDTIPRYIPTGEFSGVIATNHEEPVKTTLFKELIARYGADTVQNALKRLRKLNFVDIEKPRRLISINTFASPPLEKLLKEETLRLRHFRLREAITALAFHLSMESGGIDNELLAVASFHALLKGDSDNFLKDLKLLSGYLEKTETIPDYMRESGVYGWYTSRLHKYMKHYFGLDMTSLEECVNFYNKFFTVPVLGKEGGHIISPNGF